MVWFGTYILKKYSHLKFLMKKMPISLILAGAFFAFGNSQAELKVGDKMPVVEFPENAYSANSEYANKNGVPKRYFYRFYRNENKKMEYAVYAVCRGKREESPFGVFFEYDGKDAIFYVDNNPNDGIIDEVIRDEKKFLEIEVSDYVPECQAKI